MKATYLLIKSSVLSVTDQQKPVYSDFSANSALDFSYEEKLEAFNESFIKVDNPEVAIRAITAPIQNKVTGLYDDGLYPVDGIEFEVKEACGHDSCPVDGRCEKCASPKSLCTVSLIGDKEEKKLPTLHEHNEKKRELYDKPVDNNAGVGCEICGKEMQYVDQNLVTLGNPPSTKVTCECGNSGYKVI